MEQRKKQNKAENEGEKVIYRMWITTRDGRRIYRSNGRPFRIVIKEKN